MSFSELLQELPKLTVDQRHALVRQALEFDDPALSDEDALLVEVRLAAHRHNPSSSVALSEMKDRLSRRHSQ